jgi:hypothetical protein
MARLDLRTRLLGRLLSAASVTRRSDEQILADQRRQIEHDPLRDDGLRDAAALLEAEVAVRTTTSVGMPHGFMAFPRISRAVPQALGELTAELRSALAHP